MSDVIYSNARAYWHLFGGVADDDRIRNLYMRFMVGGLEAPLAGDAYQVSVYGREHINGANLVTLHRENIDLPDIGSVGLDEAWRYWRTVQFTKRNIDARAVRCIVLKVEALLATPPPGMQNTDYTPHYADQSTTADPPPWGVRLLKYRINASPIGTNVTPPRAVRDIVSPYWSGTKVHITPSTLALRQLTFDRIPFGRRQALDDVNALLDWDYGVWDGEEFWYNPASSSVITIDAKDPRVTLSVNADVHEVFNACRVLYTNRNGRPRETVVHADGSDIKSPVKAQTIEAPESVRTKSAAIRCGERFLRNRRRAAVTGNATLRGISPVWGDAMLLRPQGKVLIQGVPKPFSGPHKITRVQLDPLTWSASLEFGVTSRRFEVWLARVAAGAHVRQR